jgi:hypothetical protein
METYVRRPNNYVLLILCGFGIGALNRRLRKKENTDVTPGDAMTWERFVLMDSGVCWQCYDERHKDCSSPDCQCKDEVCTEIRKQSVPKK